MAKTQEIQPAPAAASPVAGMMGLGDLSVIRNILFGQQVSEFESQFDSLTARANKTDGENDARLKNMEADFTRRLEELDKRSANRFRQLEDNLAQTILQLNGTIAQTSRDDRAAVGNLLIEIGKKLSSGE